MPLLTQAQKQSASDRFWDLGNYFRDQWEFLANEINPRFSLDTPKAKILEVVSQTPDAKSYLLKMPRRWPGFQAGMHLPVVVDVNGRQLHRTYTISSTPKQFREQGTVTITSKRIPGGKVSNHLFNSARPGQWIQVGKASGQFTLGVTKAEKMVFIAGGSGITPFYAMLKDHYSVIQPRRQIQLLYFCNSAPDVIFAKQLQAMAQLQSQFQLHILLADRQETLYRELIEDLCPDLLERDVFLCGPQGLMDAATEILQDKGLPEQRLHRESFGLRRATSLATDQSLGGAVSFTQSGISVEADGQSTLLELAEAAGMTPKHGCRAGICHQCKCSKVSGHVVDIRTGEVSDGQPQLIQPCVAVPKGPVSIEL